jgi:hypothetical protein
LSKLDAHAKGLDFRAGANWKVKSSGIKLGLIGHRHFLLSTEASTTGTGRQ